MFKGHIMVIPFVLLVPLFPITLESHSEFHGLELQAIFPQSSFDPLGEVSFKLRLTYDGPESSRVQLHDLAWIGAFFQETDSGRFMPSWLLGSYHFRTAPLVLESGSEASWEESVALTAAPLLNDLDARHAEVTGRSLLFCAKMRAEDVSTCGSFAIGLDIRPLPLSGLASVLDEALAYLDSLDDPQPEATPTASGGYAWRYPRPFGYPVTWHYNPTDEASGSPFNSVLNGFNAWENDAGSKVDFTNGANTNYAPLNVLDGQNVFGWCYGCDPELEVGLTRWAASPANPHELIEAGTALNSNLGWAIDCTNGLHHVRSVATHEVGHWLGLGDMYNPGQAGYDGSFMGSSNEVQTMFGQDVSEQGNCTQLSLEWGDKAGVRYGSMNSYAVTPAMEDSTGGIGSDLNDTNADGDPDLTIAWADDNDDAIRYAFGWSMSHAGNVQSWSATKTAATGIAATTGGVGAGMGQLEPLADKPDIIVAWAEVSATGPDTMKYKIGWDVDASGNAASWSATKTMGGASLGDDTQGVGVCFGKFDTDNTPDIVIGWVNNPGGANTINYRVGFDLNSQGNAGGGWTTNKTVGGNAVGGETQGLGLSCPDLDEHGQQDIVFAFADNPPLPLCENRVYYRIGWNATNGVATSWTSKEAFADNTIGCETQGLGLASGVMNTGQPPDLTFVNVDNPGGANTAYLRNEWDVRWKSHP